MAGSVRSLRSVTFLRRLSDFALRRRAQRRRGWFLLVLTTGRSRSTYMHATHLGSIVRETVGPNEIQVVLKLALGLVLLLLDLFEHGLQIHGISND
jgi:hypothetical protein